MNIKATIEKRPWILAVIAASVVAAWMLSGMLEEHEITKATSEISAPGEDGAELKVQVATLHAQPITRIVSVYGRTAPARTVEISAETEGRVEAIEAVRGKHVATGAVIIRLDLRDRRARVDQSKASVREHRTSYNAQKSLKEEGYVSDTQIAETVAKLEAAKAELVRAELDLDNMIIRAPFNGLLQEREVEIGDFVRSGDPVATFVDNTTLIVTGTLAEQEIAHIEVGESATASLVTGQQVEGLVRYLAPVADEATRTFNVELEIDNPNGTIPAGVTAEMQLEGSQALAQKLSPALLTLDSDGQLGIFIVDEFQRADFVPVTIERSGTDGVWVSGLPEVADVITVGQGYVNPGQRVYPVEGPTETAVAAGPAL
ncbi:MAG: efflux transporter periplasmic adaptor subunit [Chromatiales bacterium]|jgi:multidrug efflux system membrane fusion protein|nr:efflux transporter periplasmic adaptor subunit [Chromatiales bacterium]MDP7093941.1 efflux RND transporter periplasmic adaptor subunit [Gammaproteobacteria bacterium]MDP7271012.1 efflux RND transporter periplasmic adaptor subunit [Gammaproteobacteria bacterium]HJP05325.1 efflux RND transporter periplasmic adaptor subunit [Gammaproteobacteria bacterium]